MPYPPNLCTSVQSVGVFVGGYGIPAIPTPPSEFLPQNPFQVCLRKSSHGIHGIHRSFRRRIFSHRFHRIHRSFRRRISSHGIHGIHRNFWRRIFSHRIHRIHRSFRRRIFSHGIHRIHRSFWRRRASRGFHRCTQIFLLRQSFLCVPCILWEDSFVAAWIWQGCHTLLICVNLCNLWEDILRQKFFAICGRIVMLVHDCFVGAAETAAPPCRMQKVH